MAIKEMSLTCDWCETEADQFDHPEEALEDGWLFLETYAAPESCFCSKECLESWLASL